MEVILWIAIGSCIGILSTIFSLHHLLIGDLRVDQSDPEDGPYLFLELQKGVSNFKNKKYVILKVNIKNYISRK